MTWAPPASPIALTSLLFVLSGRARSSRGAGRAWRKGRARRERHGSTGESDATSIGGAVSEIHNWIEKYCALILNLASERKEKIVVGRGDRLVIVILMSAFATTFYAFCRLWLSSGGLDITHLVASCVCFHFWKGGIAGDRQSIERKVSDSVLFIGWRVPECSWC